MRRTDRKDWGAIALTFLIILLLAIPAFAQPTGKWSEGHHLYHDKFKLMQNQYGTHCCGNGDCSLTQARWNGTGWEAMVEGRWTLISDSRHVIDNYGIIEPFVCFDQYSTVIWCFSPGGGF